MAINLPNSFVHILTICIFLSFVLCQLATIEAEGGLADELSTKHNHDDQPKKKMEKVYSQFTVYWHDIVLGSNATSVTIIKAPDNSTVFGQVNMIDDPLTLGPNLSSIVGRAQGLYGVTSQKDEFSLMMVMNFVFTKGSKYDGSTITIMGRNAVLSKVREMAVIGGTGLFRFARGYVRARTKSVNRVVAIVKYDIYVMHYNVST